MTGFGKRPRKINYAIDNKRVKNRSKVENAIKHFETLKKRIEFEGETKWLKNAILVVRNRLKKYGIKVD